MPTARQVNQAVRQYLQALQDPATLQDEGSIGDLESALSDEDDPLERVRLQARLIRAQSVSPEDYEAGFVDYAKEWASKNDVPAEAFLAEGVTEDVLVKAGLLAKAAAKPSRRRRTPTRTRVSADDVIDVITSQSGGFTTSQIGDLTGASTATVRKYIQQLLDDGVLVDEGTDPDHEGRGRAPKLYAVAAN